jgi:hypothetical protein
MAALAGHDYFELSGRRTIPEGLVSDPPNYAGCVARMEALVAKSPSKGPLPTGVKLLTKCRQLYEALRAQATNFLVNTQWLIDSYREYGVTVTEEEAVQFAKQAKARGFPVSEAEYPKYLAETRFTPADQLLRLKLDLLAQKGLKKFTAAGGHGYATFLKGAKKWTARTTCSPGYVVERCREFKPGSSLYSESGLPASVLIEQVASIVTGRCTNVAACGKQ